MLEDIRVLSFGPWISFDIFAKVQVDLSHHASTAISCADKENLF